MTRVLQAHPERIAIALAAAAWGGMLGHAALSRRMSCCAPHPSVVEDAVAWTAMIVAMMIPTTLDSLRDVAARSYRVRRVRAVTSYLVGYVTWWLALGVVVVAVRRLEIAHDMRLATAFCVSAAGWLLLPVRERWSRLCHRRIPLHPIGWRADSAAYRQGATNGWPCVAMCWPLMVTCTITGHNIVVMVACTALTFYEKRMYRLQRRPLVACTLLLALWTFTL